MAKDLMQMRKMVPKSKAKRIFIFFVFLILAVFVVLSISSPAALIALSREDGQIENLTAGILFATAFLSIFLYFKSKKRDNIFLLFGFFGLIGFLDEVSFGRRLFPIPMPKAHGLTIDGVHDLLHVMKNVGRTNFTYHPIGTSVVLSIFVIVVAYVLTRASISRQKILISLSKYGISGLVLIIALCIAASQVIDTFELKIFAYRAVEECLELVAAMALMTCSLRCEEALRYKHLVDQ